VGVRLARRIVAALRRVAWAVAWSLLGLWTALALFYNVPLPPWAATVLALAVAFLYGSASAKGCSSAAGGATPGEKPAAPSRRWP